MAWGTPEDWERRAPGWIVRCMKCGFTEPWGKYGIRRGAGGDSRTFGKCARCGKLTCQRVEMTKDLREKFAKKPRRKGIMGLLFKLGILSERVK